MRVSIITPSFNQGRFLEQTIKSVLCQDYADLEYIVIDGGSTDNSVDMIKKYQDKIDYWVSEKDTGQANAINKGFQRATGDIIGWLNSDDYLEPNIIGDIVKVFEKDEKVGTVCGKIRLVDTYGKRTGERFNTEKITTVALLNGSVQVNQPGAFHRKNLLEKYGYLKDELNYAFDYELWIRMGQYSDFSQINKYVASHRFHEYSKTIKEFIKFVPEIKIIRKKYGGKLLCKKTFDLLKIQLGYLIRQKIGAK